jgi:hypothetical protein
MRTIVGLLVTLVGAACASPIQPVAQNLTVPLTFEANRGQIDATIRYAARGDGYNVFLAAEETILVSDRETSLRIKFAHSQTPTIMEEDPLGQVSNYLVGSDPARWKVGIPHFSKVRFNNIYPQIDVLYYGDEGHLRSQGFIMPMFSNAKSNTKTGVAIAATDSAVNLTLTLRDSGGWIVQNGQISVRLPANGHLAKFIDEIFPNVDVRNLAGTLTVVSDSAPITGVGLEMGTRPGEFTVLPCGTAD